MTAEPKPGSRKPGASPWSEFAGAMGEWVQQERIKVREDIIFGLENASEAFIGLLEGRNFGKLVIQLAHE